MALIRALSKGVELWKNPRSCKTKEKNSFLTDQQNTESQNLEYVETQRSHA